MIANFLSLFYFRYLGNQAIVTLGSIIVYFVWTNFFPEDFQGLEWKFLFYLIFGMVFFIMAIVWGNIFGRNLNWILALPISKKKIFSSFVAIKSLCFASSLVLFYLLIYFTNITNPDSVIQFFSSPDFKTIYNDTITRYQVSPATYGYAMTIFAFLITSIAYIPKGEAEVHTSWIQDYFHLLKRKNKLIPEIVTLIIVIVIFFFRKYIISPIFICYFLTAILLTSTTYNNIKRLNVSNLNVRKYLNKAIVSIVSMLFIFNYFCSQSTINDVKYHAQTSLDQINYLGAFSPDIEIKTIKRVVNSHVRSYELKSLIKHHAFTSSQSKIIEELDIKEILRNKPDWDTFKYIITIYQNKNHSMSDIEYILKALNIITKMNSFNLENRLKYTASILSNRSFSAQELNEMLDSSSESTQAIALLLSYVYGTSKNLNSIMNLIESPPYSSVIFIQNAVKYISSSSHSYNDIFTTYLTKTEIKPTTLSCDKFLEEYSIEDINENNIQEYNLCLKRISLISSSEFKQLFLRCAPVKWPLSKCAKKLIIVK